MRLTGVPCLLLSMLSKSANVHHSGTRKKSFIAALSAAFELDSFSAAARGARNVAAGVTSEWRPSGKEPSGEDIMLFNCSMS